ncbi:MAG TPA: class I SAM-dependent methyltransferase [Acidimicrobiales bacterium]|nr:class I SAM-dependent methyltransferase [Acidimicrobiales bacterium]
MAGTDVTTIPPEDKEYYGGISFWNHFELVYRRLNERATGDPDTFWYQRLEREGHHFKRGLALNCGNGWVERDLLRIGLVDEVVGIDISVDALEEARRQAAAMGARARYERVDINVDSLPDGEFDLVINYAACHHVAALDRVLRQIVSQMPRHGLFVNWDYIGPHRNQYTARQWERAWEVNQRLPESLRQQMHYPDIETMLQQDPTEAVHSELIVPTIERYFDIISFRPLGGAVGYLLLTHNLPFYSAPLDEVREWIERVMDSDDAFLREAPEETLFAYFLARPRQDDIPPSDLARWTKDEADRELTAKANGGEYYPRTFLSQMYQASEAVSVRRALMQRWPRAAAAYRRTRSLKPGSAARSRQRSRAPKSSANG